MTDEAIVDLYFSRSESAIAETERTYGRYLSAVARGILGSDADAEEIVNDTYLKAWNAIPPEHPHTLKRFLSGITRQLSINRLEQRTAENAAAGNMRSCSTSSRNAFPTARRIRSIGSRSKPP